MTVETEHLGALVTEDLARRAIASPHWRWMPGMRAVSQSGKHWRVWSDARSVYEPEGCMDNVPAEWSKDVPDLSDPATVGCLLALVREAWGDPCLHVGLLPARWGVWTSQNMPLHECVGKALTEAEALVAALEAAP